MGAPRIDRPALTYWDGACAVAEQLGYRSTGAERAVERLVASVARELRAGARPAVALARGLARRVTVVPHDACVSPEQLIAPLVVERGSGHELAAALVAAEVGERLGLELQLAISDDAVLIAVEDAPGMWSAIIPDYRDIPWVPVPARAIAGPDARAVCAHESVRQTVRLLADALPSSRLSRALHLLDV